MSKTKQEAAEYLNVKPRTLELYTQQGRIAVTYRKGTRGQIATYDEQELGRLKAELEQPAYPVRGQLQPTSPANARMQAIANISYPEIAQVLSDGIGSRLAEAVKDGLQGVPLADKLILNLVEASKLLGLSRNYLREAISAGKLKAQILGRGWKIKRADLETYIKKL
jgi:excisionase family DNA binding protein